MYTCFQQQYNTCQHPKYQTHHISDSNRVILSTTKKVMKLSVRCSDGVTIEVRITNPQIQSDYVVTLLETHDVSQTLRIDSFESHVVTSIFGYIEHGKIMFRRDRSITPEYLQIIYKACDYFLLDKYPEIIDSTIIDVVPVVVNNATVCGRLQSEQLDTKQFSACFFSNVYLDSHTTGVSFDGCMFRNCIFSGASFDQSSSGRDCLFSDCDLVGSSLPSSRGCRFQSCLMTKAYLNQTVIEDTEFHNCSMRGFHTNIHGGVHSRNTFRSCDLSGAVLGGFDQCVEMRCILSYTTFDNRENPRATGFRPITTCPSTCIREA